MSHKREASRSAYGVAVLDHRWAYRWRAGQVRDAGDDPGGIIVTIIIGIVGAVLGGWLLSLIGIGAGAGSGGVDILHHRWSCRGGDTAGHLQAGCEPARLGSTPFTGRGLTAPALFMLAHA